MAEYPMRINKYVAERGWASRREADTLIEAGKILVNGKKAVIGQKVSSKDLVELSGKTKEKIYLAYYKGRGIITHSPDTEKGETDILTKLLTKESKGSNPLLEKVFPIGRLDKDSEGLIILSNDGRITKPLTDSEAKHEKVYQVTVDKKITKFFLMDMEKGVDIEGYMTKPALSEKKTDVTFLLNLTEGKKHQIRRMCAALGYQVQTLKRTRIENIELGKLKPNQFRKIIGTELKDFLKVLNIN